MSGDGDSKKGIAVICVSSILLVGVVIAVTVGVTFDNNDSKDSKDSNQTHLASSMKAVKSICQPTDYKKECVDSLQHEAGNVTDPKELVKIAFNITVKEIYEGMQKSQLLHELEKEPRAKMALDTCKELLEDSIDDLRRSIDKMGEFDIMNLYDLLMDLKVWLSSSITYQETCLDGFQNTTSEAGGKMKDALKLAMRMSSNGLAIIDDLASTVAKLNMSTASAGQRRLLQENAEGDLDLEDNVLGHGEIPLWVGGGIRRRLLEDKVPGLGKRKADVVVAKDGSGMVSSISEALAKVPTKMKQPFIIYVKEGIYNEYVTIGKKMTGVVMVGEGPYKTRITGNKNFIDGVNTFKTATVAVEGDYFMAVNIGFENSAGAEKHQAVALRVGSDMSVFYRCAMDGYQDTLYAHTKRQFYRDCIISGTIDFVFGDSLSVFQNCTFKVRKPMQNQHCIVTAQGRKDRHEPTAIIIQGGSIVADPEYEPYKLTNKAFLARPWKPYSRTIFMDTYIGDLVTPEGYMPWAIDDTGNKTCFYSEFETQGPGSDKSRRVKWPGVKTITPEHALDFTPFRFYKGDAWIKRTGVPYSAGAYSDSGTKSDKPNSNSELNSDPKSKSSH
ncbi:hypothetical protein L6164_007005 [Bauhinia variegata]|uniref:Uncharacterized protein n=1 Tax=Bauhinia variegata TaxID=167791 RepID=A0ACB9PWQ7_BAUVA|nr:hypothetical protein L6164_007005 [Bauhinia variegata]